MGPLGVVLIALGVLTAGAGWALARAERLTFGQGTLWVVAGAVLALAGFLRGAIAAALAGAGVRAPDVVLLLLILVAALALLVRQAMILSRVTVDLRRLASECAMLRHEEGERRGE
jgi:hypothetical protein